MKTVLTTSIAVLIFSVFNTNTSFAQNAFQLGSDIVGEAVNDNSGISSSISGDGLTVAVGAHANDGNASNAGHARVLKWDGSIWNQLGSDLDGDLANDWFGLSVSLNYDGTILAVGGPLADHSIINGGVVKVFEWDGSSWNQMGNDIEGDGLSDWFGFATSLSDSGHVLAIGGYSNDSAGVDAGHVKVYEYMTNAWVQRGGDLEGDSAKAQYGFAVSLSQDGNTLAVGARYNDSTGTVRVYEWMTNTWVQKGADLNGDANGDEFGYKVELNADGNTLAVAARFNEANGYRSGHVKVFEYVSNAWSQKGMDLPGDTVDGFFGSSLGISSGGDHLVIGAEGHSSSGAWSGFAKTYKWDGTNYIQRGITLKGDSADNAFGSSASISADGNTFVLGGYGFYNYGGAAKVYAFCSPMSSTLNDTLCFGDSLVINGTVYDSTVTGAIEVFTNVGPAECDSMVTINLVVLPEIDLTVNDNSPTLMANEAAAAYRWLDCDNNNTPISSATAQSFTASINGSYSVEITKDGCVDTSSCYNISGLGFEVNDFGDLFSVFPNPTNGNMLIDLGNEYQQIDLIVLNVQGQSIVQRSYRNSQQIKLDIDGPTGVYIIELRTLSDKNARIKVFKN